MTRIAIFLSLHALVLGGCAFLREPDASLPGDPAAVESDDTSSRPAEASPHTPGAEGTPGTARGSEAEGTPGTAGTPETPTPRPTWSAEPLRPRPSGGVVSGTLGFDAVEGGCAYLESVDGTRYQVIYPAGWSIDGMTGHLLGPGGEDARPGSVVSVRGVIAPDMASICQVGPIFRATEVISAGG